MLRGTSTCRNGAAATPISSNWPHVDSSLFSISLQHWISSFVVKWPSSHTAQLQHADANETYNQYKQTIVTRVQWPQPAGVGLPRELDMTRLPVEYTNAATNISSGMPNSMTAAFVGSLNVAMHSGEAKSRRSASFCSNSNTYAMAAGHGTRSDTITTTCKVCTSTVPTAVSSTCT